MVGSNHERLVIPCNSVPGSDKGAGRFRQDNLTLQVDQVYKNAPAVQSWKKKWEPRNPVPGPFLAKIRKVNQNSESRREFGK